MKIGETFLGVLCQYLFFINCTASYLHPHPDNKKSQEPPMKYQGSQVNPNKYYNSTWASLDSRPLPDWFDNAKIGVFLHWGVYSVPSFGSEWFWMHWKGNPSPNKSARERISNFMEANYKPGFTYQDFANQFTAELFDPSYWASLIEASGAKYVVFTSKHHDGFTMWPSTYSYSWNSVSMGPHRDVIGELSKAIREKAGIKFGLYYSLYEWFHPLYLADKSTNFTSQQFINCKIIPEMKEMVNKYKPEIIWTDGEWEAPSKYWKSGEFLSWLYNESPVMKTVVINDRWGQETLCKHGGYMTCADNYTPGMLLGRKWEQALPIDRGSWGYNRLSNLEFYLTSQQLIDNLVETIAYGGNVLMNVGPTAFGQISPIYQERLQDVGKWLKVNGEAIYGSAPWDVCQKDTNHPSVWYTTKNGGKELFVIILRWPKTSTIYLSCFEGSEKSKITFLGLPDVKIQGILTDKGLFKIELPDKALVETDWGWTVKIY